MDERAKDKSQDKVNAARGVVKNQNRDSNKNTTQDQPDGAESLDDRARKAGY